MTRANVICFSIGVLLLCEPACPRAQSRAGRRARSPAAGTPLYGWSGSRAPPADERNDEADDREADEHEQQKPSELERRARDAEGAEEHGDQTNHEEGDGRAQHCDASSRTTLAADRRAT